MSYILDLLVSRLNSSISPQERQELVSSAAENHLFTCDQLGIILLSLRSPAERKKTAVILAPCIVDPENADIHLLPFLVCDSSMLRSHVIQSIFDLS